MWLLPTLNRLSKLQDFLNSAIDTDVTTPGRIIVDREDHAMNSANYAKLTLPPGWDLYLSDAVTMGDKVRAIWPEVKDRDWVGLLNDDHFAITKGWDTILTSKLDGKNFTSGNDRWMAPMKAVTATAFSMPLLKAVGWPIYPPGLQHLFIDDIWESLGRGSGCWRVCMNSVVEHRHVMKDQSLNDSTHEKIYNQKSWDMDKAVFDNFMKHDFGITVEKIKKFQDQLPGQSYNPSPSREA